MTTHDETKSKTHHAKTSKDSHPDLHDLTENVVGIARSVRDASNDKANDAADYVRGRVNDLKASGTDALANAEKRIKAKPGQSVGIAFLAGILASFLLGRRSS